MVPLGKGKRETGSGQGVGPETMWRSPKRQRDLWWKMPEESENGGGGLVGFSSSEFVKLRESLEDICSVDDLAERMMVYLSLDCCREIFNVMAQVTKVLIVYDECNTFLSFAVSSQLIFCTGCVRILMMGG